jgi:ATP-dependent Clp protease ATP-binding subunit ClpA
VILVGPAGVGKRSLVYSLALLIAEGQGPVQPQGLEKVVQVGETALLDDAAKALQAGLRQAQGGLLFLPNIHRFFGGLGRAEFPKATRDLQKAFLNGTAVVIGTTTEGEFHERMAGDATVAEHAHVLRVPEPDERETVAILAVHKPGLEADYGLTIADSSLKGAASLAR